MRAYKDLSRSGLSLVKEELEEACKRLAKINCPSDKLDPTVRACKKPP
jgi:hypothetical protein